MGIKFRLENSNFPVINLKHKSRKLTNGAWDYYILGKTEKNLNPENLLGAMFGDTDKPLSVLSDRRWVSSITSVSYGKSIVSVGKNLSDVILIDPVPSMVSTTGLQPYSNSSPLLYNPHTGYITNDERYQGGDEAFFHYITQTGTFLESGKTVTRFGSDVGTGVSTVRQLKDILPGGKIMVDDTVYNIEELGITSYGEITFSTPTGLVFLIGSGGPTPGAKTGAQAYVRLQKHYNVGEIVDELYHSTHLEGCLINGEEIVNVLASYTKPYSHTLTVSSGKKYRYIYESEWLTGTVKLAPITEVVDEG